jgi:hypothetical protein
MEARHSTSHVFNNQMQPYRDRTVSPKVTATVTVTVPVALIVTVTVTVALTVTVNVVVTVTVTRPHVCRLKSFFKIQQRAS